MGDRGEWLRAQGARRRCRRGPQVSRWWFPVLGAAGGIAYAIKKHRAVREVLPELRAPWLYLPTPVPPLLPWPAVNRGAARAGRRLMRRQTRVRNGVVLERRVLDLTAGEVALYLYEPPQRSRPSGALLWIHGGAQVAGHPEQDHDLCSMMAEDLQILVVSVDYRLAPEHLFPAAHEDCYAALRWMHEHAADMGIDPNRVAVAGASAGGGLAATVAQHAHDEHLPVAMQVLVYPMLDDRSTLRADGGGRGRLSLTPALNRYAWTSYLGHHPTEADPGRYAAAARRSNLRGLAPAWIGVGDLDLLHDDAVVYAHRLRAAGVRCELHLESGMYHGADAGPTSTAASMTAFRARISAAIGSATAARPC